VGDLKSPTARSTAIAWRPNGAGSTLIKVAGDRPARMKVDVVGSDKFIAHTHHARPSCRNRRFVYQNLSLAANADVADNNVLGSEFAVGSPSSAARARREPPRLTRWGGPPPALQPTAAPVQSSFNSCLRPNRDRQALCATRPNVSQSSTATAAPFRA